VHAAARRVLPCATPEHPSSSAIGRVQCTKAVPQGLPNRPAPTAPPPRPDHSRTKAFRGGAPWPPVDGHPPVLPHPSTATNRLLVSPSTFPTHPPAESLTGVSQFRRAAPAGPPRGHIAKEKIFPRASLQMYISNSVAVFLILVNCVENYRKFRKM
jgi:hypothetical protein